MPQIPPIVFGPHVCASDRGTELEWLLADGLGGHATGTVGGLRTRRRHALLTVAGQVGLVALDLTLTLPSGARVPLHSHEWAGGVVDPVGHRHLETFTLEDGVPRWRWRVGDVVVERELAMRHGHPSVAVVHRVLAAPEPVGLAVAAMCTWREAGGERHATGPAIKAENVADGVIVEDAYRIAGPGWQGGGEWHLGCRTRVDAAVEDLWHAGTYVERVNPGAAMEISAWAGALGRRPPAAAAVIAGARERNRRLAGDAAGARATLVLAADAFVVRGPDGPDVVAGYPEAGGPVLGGPVLGGPVLAGYEGLFLETGRADEGREFLRARCRRPAESAEAELWLVHAVDRHVARTGDTDLAAELAAALGRRVDVVRRAVDPADELVRVSGIGKPVELNALWVNALAALAGWDLEPPGRHATARAGFAARFPAAEGWLHDVVEGPPAAYPLGAGAHDDPTLRPGQLFAWSLPHAPLAGDPAAVRAVGSALLTPLGLRTLAPTEYGYQGRGAEGAVRPWLVGAYVDACAAAGLPLAGLLDGLEAHLAEWGAGSVSESADGDPPHAATGNPFCARSVAEVLRAMGRSCGS